MNPLSLHDIRQAVAGRALTQIPAPGPQVTSVCTDTRAMKSGCLFVALSGEHFDAHGFLPDAAKAGAVAALVQRVPDQPLANLHLILVPDTRIALGKLATHVRKLMRSKVIAVAGSNGKTTTKYLIGSVLGSKLDGSMSPRSFNNDIGVPLTILPADPSADYLVLEIGTNHPGEVKTLTEMARPDIAVITNCGAEHLEFLGDLMGVRQENSSIILGMSEKSLLITNGDDAELQSAVAPFRGKKLTFGFDPKNDLFATDVVCDSSGTRFKLNGRLDMFVPMLGRHSASNALAAIAVARVLRMGERDITAALATARGPDMRLQLQTTDSGIELLNDAYNANPNSMRAALETLAALQPRGRRIAVLGDMLELGKSGQRYHAEIGELAARSALDLLFCVGEQAQLIAESAIRGGMDTARVTRCKDASTAANMIPRRLQRGDLVLLKASRSIHLEKLAQAIIDPAKPAQLRKAAS